jgi:uncharacterized protein
VKPLKQNCFNFQGISKGNRWNVQGDSFTASASAPSTSQKTDLNLDTFQNYQPHLFSDKTKYLTLFDAIKTKNLEELKAYRYAPTESPDPRYFFDQDGKTLAHRALESNDTEVFRAFFNTGFPLYVFDANGNLPGVPQKRFLLDFEKAYERTLQGADISDTQKQQLQIEMKKLLSRVDSTQTNALQKAIVLLEKDLLSRKVDKSLTGQLQLECTLAIEPLLKMGADPNVTGDHQESVLLQAVRLKNLPLVESLLKYGANPNQFWLKPKVDEVSVEACKKNYSSNKDELTNNHTFWTLESPLSLASDASDPNALKIVDVLLKANARFYPGEGSLKTPFQAQLLSADGWQPDQLEGYLKQGASVHALFHDDKTKVTTPIAAVLNSSLPQAKKRTALKFLLEKGASPNGPANFKETYLHWVISQADSEMIQLLLEAGADPNLMPPVYPTEKYPGSYWGTPLLWAAKGNGYKQKQDENTSRQFELMQCLLKAGASPNILNETLRDVRQLPLIEVLDADLDVRMMDLLLDHGANPQIFDPGRPLFERYRTNRFYHSPGTALEWAMAINNVPVIKKLLTEREMDINYLRPNQFNHLLSQAIEMNLDHSKEIVNLFLDLGIDLVQKKDDWIFRTIKSPSSETQSEFLKLLLGYGVRIPKIVMYDPTFEALAKAMNSWVEKDPVLKKAQSLTPLQASVWMGNLKRVQSLQKMGASLSDKTESGESLASLAIEAGHAEVLEYLLIQGCKVENLQLETLLEKNNSSLIQVLAKHNVNLDTRGELGRTLLHLAVKQGNRILTKALIQSGANPNLKDDMGKTPHMLAQQFGHPEILEILDGSFKLKEGL